MCGAGVAGLYIAVPGFGIVVEGVQVTVGAFDGAFDEEF